MRELNDKNDKINELAEWMLYDDNEGESIDKVSTYYYVYVDDLELYGDD